MPGAYQMSGLQPRAYVDGYGLLQSFTTGDTAHALQTGLLTLAQVEALSGVMRLDGADGVRLMFARTAAATTLTTIVTAFEPIVGPSGTPTLYIERVVSSVAAIALTTSVVATGTELNSTNMAIAATVTPSLTTIPDTALWVYAGLVTNSQPGVGNFVPTTTGGTLHFDLGGMNGTSVATGAPSSMGGITHIRVLLSCAVASNSIFCLAKRLPGRAKLAA